MSETPITDKASFTIYRESSMGELTGAIKVVPASTSREIEVKMNEFKKFARESLDQMGRDTDANIKKENQINEKLLHAEMLAWNLAGCEGLAMGSCKPHEFNHDLALPAMFAVNEFVKTSNRKIRILKKKRMFAENQLTVATDKNTAMRASLNVLLEQRSSDVDEIKRLERQLESANTRISELNLRLQTR